MEATFNLNSFWNSFSNRLEKPVREHLQNVYSCLAISTLAAAAGGYVHLFTDFLQGNFLTTLLSLGLLVALFTVQDNGKNQHVRLSILVGFAFTTGLGLGPLLDVVVSVDPSIVATAFVATCAVFACFSLSALYSDHCRWIYIGGTLMSILSMMLVLSLANLFFGSYLLFQMHLYLGLILFCFFVLYDTQLIIEKRKRGERDYIR
ncbi:Bax-mediated apoptosis inhibitor TEGT/BI-1, putative [Ixodes scapularis]|uniref:Bax-mediated apoptosis inhibitor TEGT/BI-1, putative n=2 Tax=Ixodes scapularis TaxID=6945 RepID=B7PL49_IXOSC|nr:Bax-mediated apoptosis inhibitor TEGT/BI-1, putative [Ixodes scapularis]|eukprot:XP_002434497.1 Bax-mediated apoptosis inhibitor TEGT/BI-1, putative [Ixodes scapularis]